MKALIGMSGGVDSSVAAYLTMAEGIECVGATMKLYVGGEDRTDDVQDAQSVAQRMQMPFYIFDFSDDFHKCVIDHFVHSYQAGLTPNPCVECNRKLKFDRFLKQALELGCNAIVTGHYARIALLENGRHCLRKAVDEAKDQTYFLYALTQQQLEHSRFPLGDLTKAEARRIALEQGFLNARKRDSQDICFIPDGNYPAFMERYTGEKSCPGDFLDEDGHIVGRHNGAICYTLGQRKGLGLSMGAPVYVCKKNMEENTVTVGLNESLYRRELIASDLNWMAFESLSESLCCKAKARSRMTEQPATVYPSENGQVRVVFDEPQRALTPGQAIVFYDGDLVIGGGTITEVL